MMLSRCLGISGSRIQGSPQPLSSAAHPSRQSLSPSEPWCWVGLRAGAGGSLLSPNKPQLFLGLTQGGLNTTDWFKTDPPSTVFKSNQSAPHFVGYLRAGSCPQAWALGPRGQARRVLVPVGSAGGLVRGRGNLPEGAGEAAPALRSGGL